MKLYADLPGRRTRQALADSGAVVWIVLWIWVSQRVHDAVLAAGLVSESEGTEPNRYVVILPAD